MDFIKYFSKKERSRYISTREGETKLGEKIHFTESLEDLGKLDTPFVLIGIPEDIGVRANRGVPGSAGAWESFLAAFLNVQENRFLSGEKILLLGAIDTAKEMENASKIDTTDPNYYEKLGDLVTRVDEKVCQVVAAVIKAGKFPILIGGGHNNAYGNLKGCSNALNLPVNALNIDAHTDLRTIDHRHSGNGFSFAKKTGSLQKYAVFGLHKNYTPEYIFTEMDQSQDLYYSLLEDLEDQDQTSSFLDCLDFVKGSPFGLELDCDAIAGFPSSAVSPGGISLSKAREFLRLTAKEKNCSYLHVCEAVPRMEYPTGKALSYLVTDFLRTRMYD